MGLRRLLTGRVEKQRQGDAERQLLQDGRMQLDVADRFTPARENFRNEATKDRSHLLKGRANADVAQQTRRGLGERFAAVTGRLSSLPGLSSSVKQGTGRALNNAKKGAVSLRDERIGSNIALDLGRTRNDSSVLNSLARNEFADNSLANEVKIARSVENSNLLTSGIGAGASFLGTTPFASEASGFRKAVSSSNTGVSEF